MQLKMLINVDTEINIFTIESLCHETFGEAFEKLKFVECASPMVHFDIKLRSNKIKPEECYPTVRKFKAIVADRLECNDGNLTVEEQLGNILYM